MMDNYQVLTLPENIAPTPATEAKPDIKVDGQPRNSTGHPCTLLDKQDVDDLKKAITTNPDAIKAFADLKKSTDARIAQPLDVPVAQKAADGSWMWPGDFPPDVSPFNGNHPDPAVTGNRRLSHTNEGNSTNMADLGMMYQLTGDQKYGEFCKKMLLAYADGYNNYGHPKGWTQKSYRSATDGRLTGQFLEDGFWLCEVGYAYDMIYTLPSWTAQERAHVRDDLLKAVAAEFSDPIIGQPNYLSSDHNRSALCTSGVLIAGYASDDDEMINDALYGKGGTKEAPTGGLLKVHFGEACLLPDGLWIEGAPGYQLGIASCGLFNDAETLWHHGIDMYRFRGGALKRLLDTAPALAYPDDKMLVAALHDSSQFELLDDRAWLNNEIGVPYECGYRRYQDPAYIPIIKNANKTLSMTVHAGAPSLFQDLPAVAEVGPRPVENVNFYSVGYGILRQPTADGANQVLMEFGPSAGHAHPSKLAIDVYALGQSLMQFPGVIFPYQDPLDPKWFWTTLANCAMEVDQGPQVYSGNIYKFPKGTPKPEATQVVFAPASTMGMQRAWSNTLYAGVTQDRGLFSTPQYMADLFGSFSNGAHKYDLAWHIVGTMTSTLKADPYQFDASINGYNAMTNTTHASSDQAWTATVTTPNGKVARFVAAGGTPTDVFLGIGPQNTHTPKIAPAAMIVQRRDGQNNVLFGNAVDFSGDTNGYLKGVSQEGSLDLGYALLKVETVKGTDLCFLSYRPSSYSVDGMTTDALQAMVQMDGMNVKALYLAGGSKLKVAGGEIDRSEPGLAYVEKTAKGGYVIGNPSPTKATITVNLPGLGGAKKVELDAGGQWTSKK